MINLALVSGAVIEGLSLLRENHLPQRARRGGGRKVRKHTNIIPELRIVAARRSKCLGKVQDHYVRLLLLEAREACLPAARQRWT